MLCSPQSTTFLMTTTIQTHKAEMEVPEDLDQEDQEEVREQEGATAETSLKR